MFSKVNETGKPLDFDLDRLLTTRLLIQSNSGGGKSYAIRKLLEETNGKVQQIILDLEGEFSSLREKYDFVLVGKGHNADVQIDIKSSPLLAKKLLELNVSTIIDLSELQHHERILFVKRFLEGLIEAPKELWHACLVIVDEAHLFCPQNTKAESAPSVIDLTTRGRKRGLCAVLATQRISKLHKDAAAELNNKLIGRTGLDVDMKRAGEELGFSSKDDVRNLRNLQAGEFFCFGPALSNEVTKVKIQPVTTSHPDLNQRVGFEVRPPTEKIKAMLAKLSDLPQKAEQEIKDKESYERRIRELEWKLRHQLGATVHPIDTEKYKELQEKIKQMNVRIAETESIWKKNTGLIDAIKKSIKDYSFEMITSVANVKGVQKFTRRKAIFVFNLPEQFREEDVHHPRTDFNFCDEGATLSDEDIKKMTDYGLNPKVVPGKGKMFMSSTSVGKATITLEDLRKSKEDLGDTFPSHHWTKTKIPPPPVEFDGMPVHEQPEKIGKCAKEIIAFLGQNPDRRFSKAQIGAMTGYSPRSGGFNNAISQLNTMGYIVRDNGLIQISPGIPVAEDIRENYHFSIDLIKRKLGKCPLEVFEVLLGSPDESWRKEDLAEATPSKYHPTSGGFNNTLSYLCGLELARRENGRIKLNPDLKELL
jgi:hypothetical protein